MDSKETGPELGTGQNLLLVEELRDSIRLVEYGLGCVQRIDGDNDFYHAPLLLLAGGFERFMKIVLFLEWRDSNGAFPRESDLYNRRTEGHSVRKLLAKVIERCYKSDMTQGAPALADDKSFLTNDPTLTHIVRILSHFGHGGRYFNLNGVLGNADLGGSPQADWMRLELEMVMKSEIPDIQFFKLDSSGIYFEINLIIVKAIERFARALSRLFTLGPLGELGRNQTATVGPFLNLRDEDLGLRRY